MQTIIEKEILGPSLVNLISCVRHAIHKTIATAAVSALNPDACKFSQSWTKLDNPVERNNIIQADKSLEKGAELFIERHTNAIKRALSEAFIPAPSASKLKSLLTGLLPQIVSNNMAIINLIAENPFPAVWPEVANMLAASAISAFDPVNPKPTEWMRLNRLLLAEYFRGCVLPTAWLVQVAISGFSESILSIRGSLLRIPGTIAQGRIADIAPPLASSIYGPASVSSSSAYSQWSELIGHIDLEAKNVRSGRGIVHRILIENRPAPPNNPLHVSNEQMKKFRMSRFREIEQSVISYMALCGIEQLLRSWASKINVAHMNGSEPISWNQWKGQIPCSASLMSKLNNLYEPNGPNLRNRIMHGGLLELESKRTETLVGAVIQRQFVDILPSIDLSVDNFSCENIANLCLGCLNDLRQEMSSLGIALTSQDRSWELPMALTDDEIKFGLEVYCDFMHSERAEILRRRLFVFLGAAAPVFSLCWQFGFHGWIREQWSSETYIQHMFLGLTFEGLYRLTAHMLGFSILQESNKDGIYRAKYRMLSSLAGGLCTNEVTDRLTAHLLPEERDTARTVLTLAIKARNALAHGAMPPQTQERKYGEGHLFIKSIQLLQEAAVLHLKNEAAYYNWLSRRDRIEGSDFGDWVQAEDQIDELIHRYSR